MLVITTAAAIAVRQLAPWKCFSRRTACLLARGYTYHIRSGSGTPHRALAASPSAFWTGLRISPISPDPYLEPYPGPCDTVTQGLCPAFQASRFARVGSHR